jgi:hypothetical protein
VPGRYVTLDGRRTYFPPFANERFGQPPFWSCTFTSLLNGANVAFLGAKPHEPDEIRGLANASLDAELLSGSRTSHMVTAMRRRYGKNIAVDNVGDAEARRRLAHGYVLVAGLTAPKLPDHYRRWCPGLQSGHRVALLGWQTREGTVGPRILDPMARVDSTYVGEWIPWSAFTPAWWSAEQVWFFEGQYVPAPNPAVPALKTGIVRVFAPPRHFEVAAGTIVRAYAAGKPGVVARRVRFDRHSGAMFDALVAMPVKPGGPIRDFLRVTNGAFAGRFIRAHAPGITADTRP